MEIFYLVFITKNSDYLDNECGEEGTVVMKDANFVLNSKMQCLQVKEMLGMCYSQTYNESDDKSNNGF